MIKKLQAKVLFQNDGKSYVSMSGLQLSAKRLFEEKIGSGQYKSVLQKCLCGHSAEKGQTISLKDRYGFFHKVVLCINCSLVFDATPLDSDSIVRFYEEDYRNIYSSDNLDQEAIFQKQYIRGVEVFDLCQKHCLPSQEKLRVLDVGCNAGGYLKIFQENKYEVVGIDLDDRNFEFGRKKGIDNLQKTGLAHMVGRDRESFDVIIMLHVLEHVTNPIEHLEQIRFLLKEGGLFYGEVPNIDFNIKNDILAELQNAHVWYFDEFTLTNILRGLGFEILIIKKPFHIGFLVKKNVGNKVDKTVYQQSYPDAVAAKIRAINKVYYQNFVFDPYRSLRRSLGQVKRQVKNSLAIK